MISILNAKKSMKSNKPDVDATAATAATVSKVSVLSEPFGPRQLLFLVENVRVYDADTFIRTDIAQAFEHRHAPGIALVGDSWSTRPAICCIQYN